jgi:hypothetical protein
MKRLLILLILWVVILAAASQGCICILVPGAPA